MFRLMRASWLRVLILLFEALWLNVIVPGHQRGMVPLPGESCEAMGMAGEAPARACCEHRSNGQSTPIQHGDPAQHCAICNFAARLTIPPPIDFAPRPIALVERLRPIAPVFAVSLAFPATYNGRAPPKNAA